MTEIFIFRVVDILYGFSILYNTLIVKDNYRRVNVQFLISWYMLVRSALSQYRITVKVESIEKNRCVYYV